LQRRGVFSLALSSEIPKESEAYFTGTRPLMGDPFTKFTSGNELFHAPYNAAFQTNLDPMWMCGGFRENILDDAFRKFFGSLILFLYNLNTRSWFDVRPDDSVHLYRL